MVYHVECSIRLYGVYIKRFIFKCLNACPFNYTAVAGSGKVGPINQVNHTSWVAVVTLTERPKSVCKRCVIELFCGVVCVVTLPFWHFCWCRGFCHRTESDLFLFSHMLDGCRYSKWQSVFCDVYVVTLLFFDFSVGVGAFVIGPSQISSFFIILRNRMSLPLTGSHNPDDLNIL